MEKGKIRKCREAWVGRFVRLGRQLGFLGMDRDRWAGEVFCFLYKKSRHRMEKNPEA